VAALAEDFEHGEARLRHAQSVCAEKLDVTWLAGHVVHFSRQP
jgi:hypothetical protein